MLNESEAHSITDIFCEFIEVAVHNILYIRKQYPQTIFECKRKYGIAVYHSIHPDVNEYISNCINAINFHLQRNQLRTVALCFSSLGKIIEKYNFQVLNLNSYLESDPFLVKLEKFLSDFCLKLHSSVGCLDSLPGDSTFCIQLQVTEYSNLEFKQDPLYENFSWVNFTCNEDVSSEIVPLHSIKTDCLNLQIYIEKI
jgi:mitotic spindle assembly checkpoint protein MAD2B